MRGIWSGWKQLNENFTFQNGIRRSFELGRFLNYRYVDNVFLSQNMDNSEVRYCFVEVIVLFLSPSSSRNRSALCAKEVLRLVSFKFYIQSVDINRCLMTAQSVAQGMFSPSGRVVPMPVPVHTRPLRSDWVFLIDLFLCNFIYIYVSFHSILKEKVWLCLLWLFHLCYG